MLEEQTGGATRGVGEYSDGQVRLLYVRPDLQTDAFRKRAQEALEKAPDRHPLVVDDEVGEWKADVEVHDHAIVIHLPTGSGRGILVSMDPEIARNLTNFVQECTEIVQNPPQSES